MFMVNCWIIIGEDEVVVVGWGRTASCLLSCIFYVKNCKEKSKYEFIDFPVPTFIDSDRAAVYCEMTEMSGQ